MPGEPLRTKECRPATCRDSRRRRHQTRDEVVLSGPAAAASRRVWLSDVPTSKAPCSCPVLFPAGRPRTKGLQTACPPDRFGSSILSARELRKPRRFPWLHLLSTTPSHCFGKSSEHGSATCRLLFCGLILSDIPMRRDYPGLDAHNGCNNPIHGRTETAKSLVHEHGVCLGHDRSQFVLQRWWEALDQVNYTLAARLDVGTVLNVVRRPEALRSRVVALVEQRVECHQNQRLVSCFL